MFAGTAAVGGHAAAPARAIAGFAAISILQGLVLNVGVGVGGEGPDSGDLFGHGDSAVDVRKWTSYSQRT